MRSWWIEVHHLDSIRHITWEMHRKTVHIDTYTMNPTQTSLHVYASTHSIRVAVLAHMCKRLGTYIDRWIKVPSHMPFACPKRFYDYKCANSPLVIIIFQHVISFFSHFSFFFDNSLLFSTFKLHTTCMLINARSQTACCWAITVALSHSLSLWITPPFFSIRALIRRDCLIRHSVIADYCVFPRAPVIASSSLNTVHLATIMITYTPLVFAHFCLPVV